MMPFDVTDDYFHHRIVKKHPIEKYILTTMTARYKNDIQDEVICKFPTAEKTVILPIWILTALFPEADNDKIWGTYRGRARAILYMNQGIEHTGEFEREVIDFKKYETDDIVSMIRVYKKGEFVGILDNEPWLAGLQGEPPEAQKPIINFVGCEHKE